MHQSHTPDFRAPPDVLPPDEKERLHDLLIEATATLLMAQRILKLLAIVCWGVGFMVMMRLLWTIFVA